MSPSFSIPITATGAISRVGIGKDLLWKLLLQSTNQDSPLSSISSLRSLEALGQLGYQVPIPSQGRSSSPSSEAIFDLLPQSIFRKIEPLKIKRLLRGAPRSTQLAVAAALEAWSYSSFFLSSSQRYSNHDRSRIGVILAGSRLHLESPTQQTAKRLYPTLALQQAAASGASIIAEILELEGPALFLSSTCTSGVTALQIASEMLASGRLDAILVGAVETPLTPTLHQQYQQLGILASNSDHAPPQLRPFDLHRSGTILGEGAAFLLLEKASTFSSPSAPLGWIRAIEIGRAIKSRTSLDAEGSRLEELFKKALQESGLCHSLNEIDLIHLHGTATKRNDAIEAACFQKIFLVEKNQPYCYASKGVTGHTLGASALFQVLLNLEALTHQVIPPTLGWQTPDPKASLPLLTHPLNHPIRHTATWTSGFWGNVGVTIISKECPLQPC